MTERRYTVLFEPAAEGGFVATCPVTEGNTLEEAREMGHGRPASPQGHQAARRTGQT